MVSTIDRGVVITGLGPWTPIGHGAGPVWNAVVEGRSGTRAMPFDDVSFRTFKSAVGAPVDEPSPADALLSEREASRLDPVTRLALAASALALRDAGLGPAAEGPRRGVFPIVGVDPERAGVILGTGIGGLTTVEHSHSLHVEGRALTGPYRMSLPMLIPNAVPAQVAIRFGMQGECKAVTTACASGTMAIGDAYRLLREGELDVVLAGGADKVLRTPQGYGFLGFDLLNTMSRRNDEPESASRPFDRDRDGFVLAEGAGVVVLEREAHARARGARVHARIVGYGTTCDAHSMMQLDPDGTQMARSMRAAITSSGLDRSEFGYVNAHGTATRQNDRLEAAAIREVFGHHTDDVLVNSTKAMIGHSIGGAGGIETIVTALSVSRRRVHPCVHLDHPDPECNVSLPRVATALERPAALTNSFGFGGHNATLAIAPA